MEKIIKFLKYLQSQASDIKIVFYDLSTNEIPENFVLIKPVNFFLSYGNIETYILLFYFKYQNEVKMLNDFNVIKNLINVDKQLISYENTEFLIQEIFSINIDRGEIYFNVKIAFK